MTFLGLERPVEYGRELVFDPTTALMVLNANRDYINAVYNDYRLALADMKEFNKEYGDFLSPIQADMDWYDKNVTGDVRNFINNLYAQGIDPLRSAEGRALVTRKLASMPTGLIALLRLSAEAAKEYIKNRGALEAAGKWDPDFERFANNGNMLENWDTINGGKGVWNRTSPAELKTLKELTEPWYNNREAHMLDKAGVESFNMQYDPRYQYVGFTDQDLLDIASGLTPGWNGSIYSNYYRDLARRKVQATKALAGDDSPVSLKEIEALLLRDIATANIEYKIAPTKKADEFALENQRTANNIYEHRKNKETDHYYWKLEHPDSDTDGDGNGGTNRTGYNVPEDVYLTSLAKGAGIEYLPSNGTDPNLLNEMIKQATKRQNAAINSTHNVLTATGMFISPEKVAGLIQSNGKDGEGYFLNPGYFKDLRDIEDVRTSYKGWGHRTKTAELSREIRKQNKQRSKDIVSGIKEWNKKHNEGGEYRLKVVPIIDNNDHNIYGMVGDDNKWHTYARVRVYMTDGKKTTSAGRVTKNGNQQRRDIPKEGKEMLLEIGLHSNEEKGTPDLSVTARENLGFFGYDKTKEEIGLTGNSGFPFGTNILKH